MKYLKENQLKKLLNAIPEVELAYLIGSFQENRLRKDSDLDLVLVVNKAGLQNFDYQEIYGAISKTVQNINLDLRIVAEGETDPLFLFQVSKGMLLYSKSEQKRVDFETKAMLRYYDTQHLRNIFNKYMLERIEKGNYGK